MISQRQYYGGAIGAGSVLSLTLPQEYGKFVRATGALPSDRAFTLPDGTDSSEGGPLFVISNGCDSADVEVFRSDSVSIGTISPGATGLVFLADRYAFEGAGQWYLAGSGTSGEVGDQADPTGFFFGRAFVPSGLGSDLQTANFVPDQAHGLSMDFGAAFISVPPQVII